MISPTIRVVNFDVPLGDGWFAIEGRMGGSGPLGAVLLSCRARGVPDSCARDDADPLERHLVGIDLDERRFLGHVDVPAEVLDREVPAAVLDPMRKLRREIFTWEWLGELGPLPKAEVSVPKPDMSDLFKPCEHCGRPRISGVEDEECHCCGGCIRLEKALAERGVTEEEVELAKGLSGEDAMYVLALCDPKIWRYTGFSQTAHDGWLRLLDRDLASTTSEGPTPLGLRVASPGPRAEGTRHRRPDPIARHPPRRRPIAASGSSVDEQRSWRPDPHAPLVPVLPCAPHRLGGVRDEGPSHPCLPGVRSCLASRDRRDARGRVPPRLQERSVPVKVTPLPMEKDDVPRVRVELADASVVLTVTEWRSLVAAGSAAFSSLKAKCPTCRCHIFPGERCSCCAQPDIEVPDFFGSDDAGRAEG